MNDAELAKRLLLGEKIINVEDLPVGVVKSMNVEETPHYQYFDPFSDEFAVKDDAGNRLVEIELSVLFRGKLKDLQYIYKYFHDQPSGISIIPRERK